MAAAEDDPVDTPATGARAGRQGPPARAGGREWVGLALLTLPALLVAVDFSVLNLAVPAISAALHPSSAQLLWIVDLYGFLLAGFLVPMGALGDRIGRRRLLLAGAAAFGLASVLAAQAESATTLIAARAVLGIAAATLAPSTLSLISSLFTDPRQRTTAIAVWGAALSAGGALGPVLGGALLNRFWWGSVFWLPVPIMVMLLAAGPWLLPEHRDPSVDRIDLASVALSLVAVLGIVYGVQQMAQDGPTVASLVAALTGVAAGVVLLRRQATLARPLIDLVLLRIPLVRLALAANTLSFFVILGILLLTAQYLQLVLGLSPLAAGLWTAPSMLALILGDMSTPTLTVRFRRVDVLAGGLVLAALGCLVLAVTGGLAGVVAGTAVLSLGIAPVSTLVADLVVSTAPPERAGAAAALSETTTELGGALGIAVLGSLAVVVYRTTTATPPELTSTTTAAARASLGGATDVARTLSPDLAHTLLNSARAGFTSGLTTTAAVAAAMLLLLAATAVLTTRRTSRPA